MALTAGLPTEVALTVAVFTSALGAPAGTLTRTQTFAVSPGATVAVVVSGVVQVASSTMAG